MGTNASTSQGGAGGSGVSSSITGTSVGRAGGGGGGIFTSGSAGSATSGGGAGPQAGAAGSGTVNTGGGGGGTGDGTKGTGGSGVVIIRHASAFDLATTTGSPTITIAGGNTIYTFTGSGTISWAA